MALLDEECEDVGICEVEIVGDCFVTALTLASLTLKTQQ